jgi:hypothetical protein
MVYLAVMLGSLLDLHQTGRNQDDNRKQVVVVETENEKKYSRQSKPFVVVEIIMSGCRGG